MPELQIFWAGYTPSYSRREYTAHAVKRMAREAEMSLQEYRAARFRWLEDARRYGWDSYEADGSRVMAFHARVAWRSAVRFHAEAPQGAKYCNLSPLAQARMVERISR